MAIKTLKGSCLCGDIQYSLKTEHQNGYYCHCRMCQLAFGNTHASFLNAKKKNMKWLNKKPKKYHSSKFAVREFCGRCGTPLTFSFPESQYFDISVGSLDHPEKIKPTSHYAIETAVKNWLPHDRLERNRLSDNKAIMEKWKQHYGKKTPSAKTAREK